VESAPGEYHRELYKRWRLKKQKRKKKKRGGERKENREERAHLVSNSLGEPLSTVHRTSYAKIVGESIKHQRANNEPIVLIL